MPTSSINLCSRALVKIGAHGISSFDEGTTEAHVAASLYPMVRDGLLSSYPWNFAVKHSRLAQLVTSPLADFNNAFALPFDCLRVISAGGDSRGHGLNFQIREHQLHTSAESVVLTYVYRPSEDLFPPFFSLVLIARLAAEFCIPLTDSTSRWKVLSDAAEHEFRAAKLYDASVDTPPRIDDFTLIKGRY